ncbi:MAG: hypothetical protein ACLGHY_12200, partial [Gammaproteobacteria bacterium]
MPLVPTMISAAMSARRGAVVVPAVMLGALAALVLLGPALSGGDPLGIGDVLATRLLPPGATDRL